MATLPEIVLQLQQLIPTKLAEDAPLLDSNWNKLIDYLTKNLEGVQSIVSASVIPPVGTIYIQFPGAKTPDVLYPHPTAQWREISGYFPGSFLRLAGAASGNAQAATFKSAVDLTQKNSNGTPKPNGISYTPSDGGSGGGQMDGIPNLTGSFTMQDDNRGSTDGTLFYKAANWGRGTWDGSDAGSETRLGFDASRYNAKYSSSITEVRPKNITIQIWLRDV
jgi:hypothetical protein